MKKTYILLIMLALCTCMLCPTVIYGKTIQEYKLHRYLAGSSSTHLRESLSIGIHIVSSPSSVEETSQDCTVEITSTNVPLNGVSMIEIELLNCPFAAGISLRLLFNPSIINVVKIVPGQFKNAVDGLVKIDIDNKNGVIGIAIAGTEECASNRVTVAEVYVRGVSVGTTRFEPVKAQVSDIRGVLHPVKVIGGTVRVTPLKCRIVITNATVIENETTSIDIWLINCSIAAGTRLKLQFNPSIIKIVKVIAGSFKDAVNGIFTFNIDNDNGILSIAAAGTSSCNVKRILIARLVVEGVSPGMTYLIPLIATISDVQGQVMGVPVIGGVIHVLKVLECDFNCNGRLDIGDVVLLLRILVGEFHS
ncbi:MAG: hypothetical protein GXO10_00620, partial [Crenarchaeota archaeon]|nr:hypothetical protein [Thermoproteota archaeon]